MARLRSCLDNLNAVQRRVLVLRSGYGRARPHSRRAVARMLHLRVRRVVHIERRGLREARSLSRAGSCGGAANADAVVFAGRRGGGDGLVSAPSAEAPNRDTGSSGSGSGTASPGSSSRGSGDVRGASETRLPPPLGGGGGGGAEGVSLAIGIVLILLALGVGFATPHLRGRLGPS